MPAKFKLFVFRVYSGRGTDFRKAFKLPPDTTPKQALELAKDWAEKETAGSACHEYTVNVKEEKPISRREWLRKWKTACEAYEKAKTERSVLLAVGTPIDWTKL